jgi:hypothetical protein
MFADIGGESVGVSMKTNCRFEVQLIEKVSDEKNSHIKTQIYDAEGV